MTINNTNQETKDQTTQTSGLESHIDELISQQNATEGLGRKLM